MKKLLNRRTASLALVIILSLVLSVTAFADPYRTLRYGMNGSDVSAIQRQLKKLGYFSANVGGNYLDATQRAVKAYQRASGYKATNYCSINMQRVILNDSPIIRPVPNPTYPYRTLYYGDSGYDVMTLQRALSNLGYYSGSISGNFLDNTQNAVSSYFFATRGWSPQSSCTVDMQNIIVNDGGRDLAK